MEHWKALDEKIVFDAQPYLKVVRQKVALPDGVQIDDFYQVHLRNFVVVVPVLPNGQILTIRQYKHGAGRTSLTFPAGFVEDGENPETACARELLEETGYRANELTHIGQFVDNGNQRGCMGNYYVATDCVQLAKPHSGDLEEIQIELLLPDTVNQALKGGDIAIVHHAAAWSLAKLHDLLPN